MNKNTLVWFTIGFTIFNILLVVGSHLIIQKTVDEVIQRLQKEYSPSPYGPGFDPNRVNFDALKSTRTSNINIDAVQLQTHLNNHTVMRIQESINTTNSWRTTWEADRGFNQ